MLPLGICPGAHGAAPVEGWPFCAVDGLVPGVPLVVPGVEPGVIDPLDDALGTHGDAGVAGLVVPGVGVWVVAPGFCVPGTGAAVFGEVPLCGFVGEGVVCGVDGDACVCGVDGELCV